MAGVQVSGIGRENIILNKKYLVRLTVTCPVHNSSSVRNGIMLTSRAQLLSVMGIPLSHDFILLSCSRREGGNVAQLVCLGVCVIDLPQGLLYRHDGTLYVYVCCPQMKEKSELTRWMLAVQPLLIPGLWCVPTGWIKIKF